MSSNLSHNQKYDATRHGRVTISQTKQDPDKHTHAHRRARGEHNRRDASGRRGATQISSGRAGQRWKHSNPAKSEEREGWARGGERGGRERGTTGERGTV